MEFTGERFIPGMGGAIELEHLNRYYFVVYQIDLTDKTVLDIASGEGYGSNILAQHARYVFGVDINSKAIEYSKNKYKAKNLEFIQGSATKIPLNEGIVDVIVSFETIEHHNMHEEMMHQIKRILKPNGILVISSPDRYYYSDLPKNINKYHVKELYFEQFKELINKYFKKTFHFSQRTILGSIIVPNSNQNIEKIFIIDESGIHNEFSPIYNLAICTDNLEFIPNNEIVLLKNKDEFLIYDNVRSAYEIGVQTGKNEIRNSKRYRLGKLMLRPFLIFNKIKHNYQKSIH